MADDGEEPDGPLATATIDEIAEELNRRLEGFVLIGSADKTSEIDSIQIRRGGAFVMGLGLCEYAKQWMISRGAFDEDDDTP